MYFTFEDRIFRQTEGLPMGSSISGILAILFMDKLEQIAVSSYRLISPYKRYVDDIYLQTANEEKANEFHDTMINVLIKVYNSLVQPHFDYCNVVWGNCNKGLSEKLQRLQNRAARILMSASYDSNLDDLFRALGWRRLYYQRLEQKSILMYKTLHGMTPDYLRSRFVYRDNISAYRLRNTENKLVLPQPRTDYLKRSFLYSGAHLWNDLPLDLRQASSLTDFKSKLSRHSLK